MDRADSAAQAAPVHVTFLVDANVIVYAASDSPYHDACARIIEAIADETADGRLSTAILEEVWHLELSGRVARITGLARRTHTLFAPLLPVTDETFALALDLSATQLGSNDRLHVATAVSHGIETIVSMDTGFDGVRGVRRLDPTDARALSRLLDR